MRVGGRETDGREGARQGEARGPIRLTHKEGLALVNGTQVTLACALLALEASVVALLHGRRGGRAHDGGAGGPHGGARPAHPRGARAPRARSRAPRASARCCGAAASWTRPPPRIPGKRTAPQDAYGIRCAPQVHGAVVGRARLRARTVLAREIDAATDNPLVLRATTCSRAATSTPSRVALAADHLKLCVHELGSISERRTATLVDGHMNEGLPAYLAPRPPASTRGYMLPQYVAAALVRENKVLCHPASADSIPTGANVEDHVSMGTIAATQRAEGGRQRRTRCSPSS